MDVKYKILDTNILLTDPEKALNHSFRPKEGTTTYLIVPIVVIEELDKFKHEETERGRNARQAARMLKEMKRKSEYSFSQGIPIADNYFLQIVTGLEQNVQQQFRKAEEDVRKSFPSKDSNISLDNRILAVALAYKRQYADQAGKKNSRVKPADVELVTQDTNLAIKADTFGVTANDWADIQVIKNVQDFYKGYRELTLDSKTYEELSDGLELDSDVPIEPSLLKIKSHFKNEFFRVIDESNPERSLLAKSDPFNGGIHFFAKALGDEANDQEIVHFQEKKYPVKKIAPRNYQQACALEALLDRRIPIVHLIGRAGTGKTLMALAAGMKICDDDEDLELLITKPVVPVGGTLGFLPGTQEEKLTPWMDGISDNLTVITGNGATAIKQYEIKMQALETIRGRSINYGYYVVDEAQNLTPKEIKTVITRMGDDSKIVIIGDPSQVDHPALTAFSTGLLHSSERLKDEAISATVYLSKGERGKLATIAAEKL